MLGSAIMAAIDDLPDVFRATEALGVPPGTIRSRMKRGRTLLQKALWRQASDAGITSRTDT